MPITIISHLMFLMSKHVLRIIQEQIKILEILRKVFLVIFQLTLIIKLMVQMLLITMKKMNANNFNSNSKINNKMEEKDHKISLTLAM